MGKVLSQTFFLSRFPRFMLLHEHLWKAETHYPLIGHDALFDTIIAQGSVIGAPATYEAFNAASRADAAHWPLAWVHRYNKADAEPGSTVTRHEAHGHAHLVGSVRKVAELLATGQSLNRFHKLSSGGRNAFEMPPL